MPVKIRMQRRGRAHHAEFAIVAADSRAPRDGRFIEKLGIYNPNTTPATITLNFERALHWVQCGAQPTETARTILSTQGVLMMDHLLRGVKKGAFDENEAKRRFEEWKSQKVSQIQKQKEQLKADAKKDAEDRFKAEQKVKEKRALAISEKLAKAAQTEDEETAPTEENNTTEENN